MREEGLELPLEVSEGYKPCEEREGREEITSVGSQEESWSGGT